jgi:hypothetical protein
VTQTETCEVFPSAAVSWKNYKQFEL